MNVPANGPKAATLVSDGPARVAKGVFDFLDESHVQLQQQLQVLHGLVDALENEGLTSSVRQRCRAVIDWFNEPARQHHLDEEKHIFPALLASGDADTVAVTERLIQDHGWLETDWLAIEPMLSAAADGYSSFDVAVLRDAVGVFEQLYLDHLVLEETQAYPAARSQIAGAETAAMSAEMVRRRSLRENRGELGHR